MADCDSGECDHCGIDGKFAFCVAPSPHHLHACCEVCRVALLASVKA